MNNEFTGDQSNRLIVKLLGITVGTAEGWDENGADGGCGLMFYDFVSIFPGLNSCSCLSIDYNEGTVVSIAEDGEETMEANLTTLFG